MKIKILFIWDGGGDLASTPDEVESDFNRVARRKGVRLAIVPVHPYGDEKVKVQEVSVLYRSPRKAKDEDIAKAANAVLREEWG